MVVLNCTLGASVTTSRGAALVGDQLREGVQRLAQIAFSVNESTENIGARRLHTVMEKLLEEVSFNASRNGGQKVTVDAAFVNARLDTVARDEDLARYVL
jgi:ATP-dependent HslUV protease ATP-binding subunit HslU